MGMGFPRPAGMVCNVPTPYCQLQGRSGLTTSPSVVRVMATEEKLSWTLQACLQGH